MPLIPLKCLSNRYRIGDRLAPRSRTAPLSCLNASNYVTEYHVLSPLVPELPSEQPQPLKLFWYPSELLQLDPYTLIVIVSPPNPALKVQYAKNALKKKGNKTLHTSKPRAYECKCGMLMKSESGHLFIEDKIPATHQLCCKCLE